MKICHLTSAHPRYDTRIFIKECQSLARYGYAVNLVVADGKGDELNCGVNIYDVGKLSGRIKRMLTTTKKVYQQALAVDADIYHLHDPELIPSGLKLLKKGKKVIFDAHEDLPKQVLSKPYLRPWQAKLLAALLQRYEAYALSKVSGVVAATPFIAQKFASINTNSIDVNNFPILGELGDIDKAVDWQTKQPQICYVGGLEKVRGVKELVQALEFITSAARLHLGGVFSDSIFAQEVRSLPAWQKVAELGFLSRNEVREVFSKSFAGLVTLHPIANYLDALPVKMFEYMAAGIPVIASDIPLWADIINGNQCGICVNPMSPQAIAEAIDYLAAHPEVAANMGKNGKQAVLEKYNWALEEQKLLEFYQLITQ